jgi:hypothetical protein
MCKIRSFVVLFVDLLHIYVFNEQKIAVLLAKKRELFGGV